MNANALRSIVAAALLGCGMGDPARADVPEPEATTGGAIGSDDGRESSGAGSTTDGGASSGEVGSSTGDAEPGTGSGSSGSSTEAGSEGSTGTAATGLSCSDLPGVRLCDDFDGPAIDATKWTVVTNGNTTVTVDATRPFHGTGSLHIQLPAEAGAEGLLRVSQAGFFPLPDNTFFGRVYFHVTPAIPDRHSYAMEARGFLPDGEPARYRLDGGAGGFNSRYYTPTIEAEIEHGGLRKFGHDVPLDAWVCIEWEYDGAHDEMRYWFDGVEETTMTVLGSEDPPWVAPAFDRFFIGWHLFHEPMAAETFDIWYDQIALSDERIGCGDPR